MSRLDVLLRPLGLTLLLKWLGFSSVEERQKIAMERDRSIAFLRCLVHMAPLTGVLILFYLNFSRIYIGPELKGISGLQFAAKIHELMMVASLGSAAFSYLRYHLTLGDGLPFGAVFSGLQMYQLAYLWSPEFWGSVSSRHIALRNKISLILVIILTVVLASTVGPASAACMIPRPGNWPAGKSFLSFNGSLIDLYPTILRADDVPESCSNTTFMTLWKPRRRCPSDGWQDLLSNLETVVDSGRNFSTRTSIQETYILKRTFYTKLVEPYPRLVDRDEAITSASRTQPRILPKTLGDAAVMHGYTSSALQSMDIMDSHASVHCSPERPMSASSEGVPNIIWFNSSTTISAGYTNLSDIDIQRQTPPNRLSLLFVPIRQTSSTALPIGMVVVNRRDGPLNISTCSFDAGWLPATMRWTWESWTTESINPAFDSYNHNHESSSLLDLRRANMTADWLRYVNPIIAGNDTTVFETLLGALMAKITYWPAPAIFYAPLASSLISLALSNVPPTRDVDVYGPDLVTQSSTERLWIQKYTYGLSYGPSSPAVRLALGILMLYCLVVVVHIYFSLRSGLSSASWDSMAEMMALGMNSRPTNSLQNTCAGIRTIEVFKERVRIVPTAGLVDELGKGSYNGERGHLELLFLKDSEVVVVNQVQTNVAYGTC